MQSDKSTQVIDAAKRDLKEIVNAVLQRAAERVADPRPCAPSETYTAKLGKWAKKWRRTLRHDANCDVVLVRGETGLEVEFNTYTPEGSPAPSNGLREEIIDAFPHLAESGSCSATQLERMREAGVLPGRRGILEFNGSKDRPRYLCNGPEYGEQQPQRARGEKNSDRWPPSVIASKFPAECREILNAMTQYQKHVFVCFYALGQKLATIATANGTTESKVSEVLSRIDALYAERGIPMPCHVRPTPAIRPQIEDL